MGSFQCHLNQGYHTIIQYPHEFIPNAIIDFLMTLFLDASDALSFYENLVRNAWQAKYAPGSPIITSLLEEQLLAGGDYLFILCGSFCHSIAVQNKAFY